jgi:hypothetical protein
MKGKMEKKRKLEQEESKKMMERAAPVRLMAMAAPMNYFEQKSDFLDSEELE